ncbi:MAG: ABC transporter ATP-binding protein [Wenzhouxiangellaceae bacterium]|nr:ABC transporter ATP-binding protein [Wenzhouxiangellaceae bacterium]
MSSQPIATCRGLAHRYGSTDALSGVDLDLPAGAVTALLGPNGAGKTTLIHLLLGLLPLRQGTIRLFGDRAPGANGARSRIGAMLQISGVQDNLTVRELVELFASFYPDPAEVADLVEECGLAGLEGRRFDRLSGGQKQRTLFALAAVGRPGLLVLDEPTTGLDPAARRRLWSAIEARRARGDAILLSTHFMEEADRLADRVVVLDGGRVLARGTPAEIRRRVPRDTIRVRSRLGAERLSALPGVVKVRDGSEGWTLLSGNGVATTRALLEADPDAAELEVRGADLETAFLALTGDAPTDDGVRPGCAVREDHPSLEERETA